MSFLILIISFISLFCTMPLARGDIKPLELKDLKKQEDLPERLSAKNFITEKNKNISNFFEKSNSKKQWIFFNKKEDLDPLKSSEEESKVFAQSLYGMSRLFYGKGDEYKKGAMLGFAFADNYEKMNDVYELLPKYEGATSVASYLKKVFDFITPLIGSEADGKKISNLTEAMLFRANQTVIDGNVLTAKGKIPSSSNFNTFHQEAVAVLAHQYKIHLQVKQEYIISFVQDLLKLISETEKLNKYIGTFKIARYYHEGAQLPPSDKDKNFHPIPVIVLYTVLIPGDKKAKQTILDGIIDPLVKRYGKIAGDIALKDSNEKVIQPRFNHKINDLIWIAGGNGDDKLWYRYYITTSKKLKNTLFTDDYAFYKGYEYSFTPQEKETKKSGSLLATALDTLKEKLKQLAYALSGKQEKKKVTFAQEVKKHEYENVIDEIVELVSDDVITKIAAVKFVAEKIKEKGKLPKYKNLVQRNLFFKDVMGIDEKAFKADIESAGKFISKEGKNYIITKHEKENEILKKTEEKYQAGYFEQLSVEDLIKACKGKSYPGGGTFSVIEGTDTPYIRWYADKVDIGAMQADPKNKDAVFQVASNFNGLETPDAKTDVETDFLEYYTTDRTQGPFASISAAPGLIYRRYYLFYDPSKDPQEWGQAKSGERKVNFLSGTPLKVSQGGYVLLNKTKDLPDTSKYKKIKIGWHQDIQVSHGFKPDNYNHVRLTQEEKTFINQVFTAAADFGQGTNFRSEKNEAWGKEILKAAYEGTLRAAFVHGKKKVVLTLIGGGAFKNDPLSIVDAMLRMGNFIKESGLDVTVVWYDSTADLTKDHWKGKEASIRSKLLGLVRHTGGSWTQYRIDGVYSPK